MRTKVLAVAAAALLTLAACGGDDDSGDATTTPAASEASATTADATDTTADTSDTTEPAADATTAAPDDTDGPDDTEAPGTDAPATDAPTTVADVPDGALDVCALLTQDDLAAAFGSTWDPGTPTHQEQTGGDQCTWSNIDVPPVKIFSIVIYREGSLNPAWEDNGLTVEKLFEETKEFTTVDEELELGDESYRAGSTIAVLDGGTSYSFDTFLGTSDEAIAGLRKLAEQVVAAGI